MTFYHYTCEDGAKAIGKAGKIKPNGLAGVGMRFAWFTDLAAPHRDALGLTSNFITCDRTTHRYRVVEDALLQRWVEIRRSCHKEWVAMLENSPGAKPMHWWVSDEPVGAIYDPIGGK